MIFPYIPLPTQRPIPSLGGAKVRHRPLIPIQLMGAPGAAASLVRDGCVDSASDDTIFRNRLPEGCRST